MWPGQQTPGGEQDPPEEFHNPYRQPPGAPLPPGPAAPPPPAAPPTAPPSAYPVGGPYGMTQAQGQPYQSPYQPPRPAKRSRTVVIAVCAAAAVVVAAATVTGVVLLGDDAGRGDDRAIDGKDVSPSGPSPTAPSTSSSSSSSGSPSSTVPPTIKGWKSVVNPEHGTAFDVPADWEVAPPTVFSGYSDDADGEKILIGHTAPAFYKSKWCSIDGDGDGRIDDYKLAATGTKGAAGAKDTREVAEKMAPVWVYAAYTQPDKSAVKTDQPVEYTTKSGVKGTYLTSHSEGAKKTNKCSGDGRSIVFGFKNAKGDFVAWDFYGRTGVPGAIADELVMRILSTVRLTAVTPTDPSATP
ncbi:hypothetical protein ACIBEA_05240 [Streptomyces sp. NPDC051555]|uniref:hypothetical protein n=1 Tax=Streptomyces sp. NPDC051555 TaxID=3365657 RepID=UPI00378EE183